MAIPTTPNKIKKEKNVKFFSATPAPNKKIMRTLTPYHRAIPKKNKTLKSRTPIFNKLKVRFTIKNNT
jgi:hypothetical protein